MYELDSPEKSGFFPPCIQSVQNLTPLTDFFAKDSLPFLPKRPEHHTSLREDEKYPYWPNLIGSSPILSGGHLKLYNLYDDGAIYFLSSQTSNIKINHDYIKSEEELLFKQYVETEDFFQNTQFLNFEQKKLSGKSKPGLLNIF